MSPTPACTKGAPPSAKPPSWRCASPAGTKKSSCSARCIPNTARSWKRICGNLNCEVVVVPTPNGTADLGAGRQLLVDDKTACLIVQHPNFFGCLEQARQLTRDRPRSAVHCRSSRSIPSAWDCLKRPGDYGADIAVAEGQSLGIPLQYGGPYLGILACRKNSSARCPGRLIGQTTDRNGKALLRAEPAGPRAAHPPRKGHQQHLHESGAAGAAGDGVPVAARPAGTREAAELCCRKAHYAGRSSCAQFRGVELMFDRPFFKEFTLEVQRRTSDDA